MLPFSTILYFIMKMVHLVDLQTLIRQQSVTNLSLFDVSCQGLLDGKISQ